MPYSKKNLVKCYIQYSEIFRKKYDQEELKNVLSQLPLGGLFNILSQMMFIDFDNRKVRTSFANFFRGVVSTYRIEGALRRFNSLINERILYTPQGLLSVWKWLFAYGNSAMLYTDVTIYRAINNILYTQMIIADYLDKDAVNDVISEIIRNLAFNSFDNPLAILARAKHIYVDIASNRELYNEKEFLDINLDFCNTYGCSIKEYICLIFGIFSMFLRNEVSSQQEIFLNKIFSNTPYSSMAEEILRPLCFTFDEGKVWARDCLEASWNFTLFQEKPLFIKDNGSILPISVAFLMDQLFISLFWKVRNCYPSSDAGFLRYFGRPFEEYIKEIISYSNKSSGSIYKYIQEFAYGPNKHNREKRSPEVLLIAGNKLLAIEGKGQRMSRESLVIGSSSAINKDFNKLVLAPLRQLCNRVTELKSGQSQYDFSNINEIHFIVVNQEDFPTLLPYEHDISKVIAEYSGLPIQSFCHMDIEELEMFSYLICKRKPIFKILSNKMKLGNNMPFKNFLFTSSLPHRIPSYIGQHAEELMQEMKIIFFPDKIK